ncbi:hypothetical protein [Microbacterium aurum]
MLLIVAALCSVLLAWRLIFLAPKDWPDRLLVTGWAAEIISWLSAIALVLLAQVGQAASWLVVLLSASGIGFLVAHAARRLHRSRSATGLSTGQYLSATIRRWGGDTLIAAERCAKIVAPSGWSEVRVGFDALDRILTPGTMVRGYTLAALVSPPLFAIFIVWMMSASSGAPRAVLAAVVGYNALAVVSIVTMGMLLSVILLVVLTYCDILDIQLDIRRTFMTIVGWIGVASAVGAGTAALLPIVNFAMPLPALGGGAGTVAPSVLVDVPAAFAVVGYALGVAHASVDLCRRAANLVLRRFTAPLTLGLVVTAMVAAGAGPSAILASLLAPLAAVPSVDCDQSAVESHANEPAWILRAVEACADGRISVDDLVFLSVFAIVLAAFAITAFVVDFRRAASELHPGSKHEPVSTSS